MHRRISPPNHLITVKMYGDVITECDAEPLLRIDLIKCIGKESNSLEAVDEGLEHSQKNVYTEYVDLKREEWSTKILPALKKVPLKTLVTTLKGRPSRSTVIELRAGRSRPHRKTQELLVGILKKLKLI